MIGKPELTEQQIQLIDSALESYFDAHFYSNVRTQETELLDLIIETRIDLAQSLPCSECSEPRMGHHSDLCGQHYAQLTRGELKVRVA